MELRCLSLFEELKMVRFNQTLIAFGAFGLLTLSGCNSAENSAPVGAPPPGAPPLGAPGAAAVAPEFQGLAGVVAKTKAAIDTGDFAKTGEEFSQFEGSWAKVKEGVKTKSPETFTAIEDARKNVTAAIKAADKEKVLRSLKILGDSVLAAGKP
jgi:hypothetical protein